eukprot:gene21783-18907_t
MADVEDLDQYEEFDKEEGFGEAEHSVVDVAAEGTSWLLIVGFTIAVGAAAAAWHLGYFNSKEEGGGSVTKKKKKKGKKGHTTSKARRDREKRKAARLKYPDGLVDDGDEPAADRPQPGKDYKVGVIRLKNNPVPVALADASMENLEGDKLE